MAASILVVLFLAFGTECLPAPSQQSPDTTAFLRLERLWNDAHLRSDTATLRTLWDDDLVVVVPEMPVMGKPELLRFWRSGRSNITRYESTDLRVRDYGETAVVTGRVRRERNFNGQIVSDDWRFIKVYRHQGQHWRVVAYQASPAPG